MRSELSLTTRNGAYNSAKCRIQTARTSATLSTQELLFKDEVGTSTWKIRGTTDEQHLTRVNTVPGSAEDQSAYRSELAGLYGIVSALTCLCQHLDIREGAITVSCDGEVTLDYVFDWSAKWLKPTAPHLDLVSSLSKMIQSSSLQWRFRYVKGHQDDFAGPLDRWATLNVAMDQLAKDYWAETHESGKVHHKVHNKPWSIWNEETKLITPIRSKL